MGQRDLFKEDPESPQRGGRGRLGAEICTTSQLMLFRRRMEEGKVEGNLQPREETGFNSEFNLKVSFRGRGGFSGSGPGSARSPKPERGKRNVSSIRRLMRGGLEGGKGPLPLLLDC